MTDQDKTKYLQRTERLKALASPTRLQIIDILTVESPLCVCEIQERVEVNMSTLSRHLDQLRQAGFLEVRKEGRKIYYTLKACCLDQLFACIENLTPGVAAC